MRAQDHAKNGAQEHEPERFRPAIVRPPAHLAAPEESPRFYFEIRPCVTELLRVDAGLDVIATGVDISVWDLENHVHQLRAHVPLGQRPDDAPLDLEQLRPDEASSNAAG